MLQQLSLPIRLNDEATFHNFFPAQNLPLIQFLQTWLVKSVEPYVYLYGSSGDGCSHLLQACYQQLLANDVAAIYLPFDEIRLLKPEIFTDIENYSFVMIDDVDKMAGDRLWEEALFHLFNRLQQLGNRLLVAAHGVPGTYSWCLPDLSSRLLSGLMLSIKPLTDKEKLAALQWRAQQRGLELSDEVGQFLLKHVPRNFNNLLNILEKLDRASLQAQRRLTVPFVKNILLEQKILCP